MFRILQPVLLTIAAVWSITCTAPPADPSEAIGRLAALLQQDSVYASWITMECLAFTVEQTDADFVYVVVRETHRGNCPGDSLTSPVVDRFRVARFQPRIEWFNVDSNSEDQYESYDKLLANRRPRICTA